MSAQIINTRQKYNKEKVIKLIKINSNEKMNSKDKFNFLITNESKIEKLEKLENSNVKVKKLLNKLVWDKDNENVFDIGKPVKKAKMSTDSVMHKMGFKLNGFNSIKTVSNKHLMDFLDSKIKIRSKSRIKRNSENSVKINFNNCSKIYNKSTIRNNRKSYNNNFEINSIKEFKDNLNKKQKEIVKQKKDFIYDCKIFN